MLMKATSETSTLHRPADQPSALLLACSAPGSADACARDKRHRAVRRVAAAPRHAVLLRAPLFRRQELFLEAEQHSRMELFAAVDPSRAPYGVLATWVWIRSAASARHRPGTAITP